MQKPNILFIFTDQQTLNTMSACGNPHLHTPQMDSIAARGVLFENSYCTSPVCCPARSSLVTGMMPHTTGINVNSQRMREGLPNIGETFRAAGYETAWTGKYHVHEPFAVEGVHIPGFEVLPFQIPEGAKTHFGSATDAPTADQAIAFLRRKREKPFFLTVSLQNPHDICAWIMGKLDAMPALDGHPLPPLPGNFVPDPEEPEFISLCRQRRHYGNEANWTVDWNERKWREYISAYYRLTERVDVQIGRILNALREEGLEENTLILFTSDHGEGIAAHRWVVKLMLYEEPAKVPFILSGKGVTPAGRKDSTHLVSGIDVFPTLCDYAGITPPAGLQGISLKPLVENPGLPGREYVVAELSPDTENLSLRGRMLRTAQYKYVAFSQGRNPEMLFHLAQDPGETNNLARKNQFAPELERHRALLRDWMAKTHDDFALPNG